MSELKYCTYQLHHDSPAPVPGQYLVTLGKKEILHIQLIKSVRKINHLKVKTYQGYALELIDRPDLKLYTEFERVGSSARVWVRGEEALPCFWLPRGKSPK